MIEEHDLASRIETSGEGSVAVAELLRGRYEALEIAGTGGQADVVRAWDHQHGRPVALKVRPVPSGTDPERVLEEARTLLGLRPHANVAIIRDDFFEGDLHYLVLDWVSGENLRTRLRRDGAPGLPFDVVLAAVTDVAAALDHLHAHEPPVVHGDVKPANIVVTEDDPVRAVLVDFGLASAGGAGAGGASLAYAAPEAMSGEDIGPASDVYSLAATTFELLTGRVPIPGATLDWSVVPADHVAAVRDALVEGLALDPGSRPATAGEFVARLGSGQSTPRRALARPTTGTTRRRFLAIAGAAAAAAVGGGVVRLLANDDAPAAVATEPDETQGIVPIPLPEGVAPIGRLGIYSRRGVMETYTLGDDGTLARVWRQTGLTNSWDTITPLGDRFLFFYRGRDAYGVMVDWAVDGAILDLYTATDLPTRWSHVTPVRDGYFHFYNEATGEEQLVAYDDQRTITGAVPLAATRPGWSNLVSLAEGSLLRYDTFTGETVVSSFDAAGAPSPEQVTLTIEPGLTELVGAAENRMLLALAGETVKLVEVAGASVTVLSTLSIEEPWNRVVALAQGRVALYDDATGRVTVLTTESDALVATLSADVEPGGTVLIGRP